MDINGQTWVVTVLDDGTGALTPPIEGSTMTLVYDGERVNGTAGCNNYFGPATLGETAQVGPLASTMMFCSEPDGVMDQEMRFLALLDQTHSAEITSDRIEMRRGGHAVMVLAPLLVGLTGSWSVLFYNNGIALISPIPDTEITAIFEDGRLRGLGGCNRYTATYESDGALLRISPPAGTRMSCTQPEGLMSQEARYLELLPSTASYLIRNERLLDLYDTDGLRIVQFVRI